MLVQNSSDSFGILKCIRITKKNNNKEHQKKGECVKEQTICWGWEEFWEGIWKNGCHRTTISSHKPWSLIFSERKKLLWGCLTRRSHTLWFLTLAPIPFQFSLIVGSNPIFSANAKRNCLLFSMFPHLPSFSKDTLSKHDKVNQGSHICNQWKRKCSTNLVAQFSFLGRYPVAFYKYPYIWPTIVHPVMTN